MGFFLSPIKFVFELIGFLISAAFVYGLALIVAVTIITYGIIDLKSREIVYVHTTETVVETVEVEVPRIPAPTCDRIAGCETFPSAETEKEYCPTCVVK